MLPPTGGSSLSIQIASSFFMFYPLGLSTLVYIQYRKIDMDSTNNTQIQKSWKESFDAFLDKRVLIMLFLGFSAGIPILLIFSSLGLWLDEAGIKKSTVTMFSWAALGYSFKFIWAPLIDALPVPFLQKWLGRRRSWLLVSQCLIIAAIVGMAVIDPSDKSVLYYMAAAAVLLGFSSATQDIVIDAYRIEMAPAEMQPTLSSVYVAGYRVGMVVAGAGALYLAEGFGSVKGAYNYHAWYLTYLIMAGTMLVGITTTLASFEPKAEIHQPKKQLLNEKVAGTYAGAVLIPLLLVVLYFLADLLLTNVFNISALTLTEVGTQNIMGYFKAMFVFLPFVLLLLVFNQPKITNTTAQLVEKNTDYVRLVAVFLLSVMVFIFAFMTFGTWFDGLKDVVKSALEQEKVGPFIKFLFSSVQMLASLMCAVIAGVLLVRAGLVSREVADKTWVAPVRDFFERYGKHALLLLALIGFYRISDIVAGVISNLFYADMGFSKSQIATAVKTVGVILTIFGGMMGGVLAQRYSVMKCLMWGAILCSVTNLVFVLLTYHPGDLMYMYFAVIIDNLAAGFAMGVFIAFLSALTNIKFTAVQYAIFSSLMTLLPKVIGGYSGSIVENIGYANFFIFCALIGLPVLVLVYLVDKHIDIGTAPK